MTSTGERVWGVVLAGTSLMLIVTLALWLQARIGIAALVALAFAGWVLFRWGYSAGKFSSSGQRGFSSAWLLGPREGITSLTRMLALTAGMVTAIWVLLRSGI